MLPVTSRPWYEIKETWNSVISSLPMVIGSDRLEPIRGVKRQQYRNYVNYLQECLSGYDSVFIVRVDLSYINDVNVDHNRLRTDFNKWKERIRDKSSFKNSDVGHIWKLERGYERDRWHIHILMIYSEEPDNIEYLVDQWKEVTGGDGNVYVNYDSSPSLSTTKDGYYAVGQVELSSKSVRIGISYMLMYFFKDDDDIREKMYKGIRMYGRGIGRGEECSAQGDE